MSKFTIRPAWQHDWNEIIAIYNYYILNSVFNFEYDTYTLQSRLPWFQQFENPEYQLWVGCNNDQIAGYIATTPFSQMAGYHTSVNISIYCRPEYTQVGLGSKLLNVLMEQNNSTKIHKMYAGITIPNDPSQQLFKKFGFKQAAYFKEVGYKFNQFWDVVWLEKDR